jgi:hypothetical protein
MGGPAGSQYTGHLRPVPQSPGPGSNGDAGPTHQYPAPGDRHQQPHAHATPDEHPDAGSHGNRHSTPTGSDLSPGGNRHNPAGGHCATPYRSTQ